MLSAVAKSVDMPIEHDVDVIAFKQWYELVADGGVAEVIGGEMGFVEGDDGWLGVCELVFEPLVLLGAPGIGLVEVNGKKVDPKPVERVVAWLLEECLVIVFATCSPVFMVADDGIIGDTCLVEWLDDALEHTPLDVLAAVFDHIASIDDEVWIVMVNVFDKAAMDAWIGSCVAIDDEPLMGRLGWLPSFFREESIDGGRCKEHGKDENGDTFFLIHYCSSCKGYWLVS